MNPTVPLQKIIKSQRESCRNRNKPRKKGRRQQKNGSKYIPINNYFKCKRAKFFNQKTE